MKTRPPIIGQFTNFWEWKENSSHALSPLPSGERIKVRGAL